ncbi:Solute carrier family 35 member F3, partial [Stegodyphus mimosarum]
MGDVDVDIYSISGLGRGLDMHSGRSRQLCPAVVITHDSDTYSSSSINPSSGEGLLNYKGPSGLGSSTLSLAADGRNGVYTAGPPSRTGSPRHSKIHPSEAGGLSKSGSTMAVFSTDGQLPGNESQTNRGDRTSRKPMHCCTGRAKRTAIGFFLTVVMCGTWIGVTHLLKWAYVLHLKPSVNCNCSSVSERGSFSTPSTAVLTMTETRSTSKQVLPSEKESTLEPFKAPFLTTWFCTACNCLFFPVYLCTRFCSRKSDTTTKSFLEEFGRFSQKGLTILHFFTRSMFFCVLWVATNYMLINALGKLDATAVMALQASSASFVYLLSWVILHDQFVGIRIVAVILCDTGIALLAYMDGVSRTSTLGGVVLASAAAAGLAVHK